TIGDPAWATVERVELLGSPPPELLRHSVMRSLTHVSGLPATLLAELLSRPVPYRTLGISSDELPRLIAAHERLSALRGLELSTTRGTPEIVRPLWASPLCAHLEHVAIAWSLRALPSWLRELDGAPRGLRTIDLAVESLWHERVELSRDERGRFAI